MNWLRRFSRQPQPQLAGVVLMYHRVADFATDATLDPWGLCVSPQHFEEHLQVLAEYGRCLTFSDFAATYQQSTAPQIAITFDDGYVDNLTLARPLLAQYDQPATVFIATAYTGGEREFWWDKLAQLLLLPPQLPSKLHLAHGALENEWQLDTAAAYPPAARRADVGVPPWEAQPGTRLGFYYDVWLWLRPLPHATRQHLLLAIQEWTGAAATVRPEHRPMTLPELEALAADGLVEIGAHTLTHPQLTAHSAAEQLWQMAQSKQQLESWLSRPIPTFSYPFGEYDKTTLKAAQQAGFNAACTVDTAVVTTTDQPLALPRYTVNDWDGETFARTLWGWLAQ